MRVFLIVLLLIVEAWRIGAFENPDAHRYHSNSHVTVNEQENNFFVKATLFSHWLDWPCDCWERIRAQYCPDVESVFGLWAYNVFLLVRPIMWLPRTNQSKYCSDVAIVSLLSNSYMEVLVISVLIRIFKCPNSSCHNY